MERSGNKKFQYLHSWNILKSYPKWDVAKPIDEDNLAELFGLDPRARPAGKPRPTKKAKSVDTSSARGSHSKSLTGVTSQDYRGKCEAAKAAYEAKRKKELGLLECRELEFLMIDPSPLPPEKATYIRRKQDEIMKKNSKRLFVFLCRGLPSLKLSLHSCSLPGSTNAMGIETSIALVLPVREHECDTSFVLGRPPALS
ncbi:hypothetical protein Tco_0674242 [Tanacetum coccineum]